MTREEAYAFALSLPGTLLEDYYGAPSVKVAANGRPFLMPGREADSFGIAIDIDTKEMLMETDPATFWETPHYTGWPMVLVRMATPDPERVKAVIEQAYIWSAARPKAKARKKT